MRRENGSDEVTMAVARPGNSACCAREGVGGISSWDWTFAGKQLPGHSLSWHHSCCLVWAGGGGGGGHLRLRLEDCGEEVAVAVLVLAPVLEILKEGVQLIVWVALQVPVDADVAPVADLHKQVTVGQAAFGCWIVLGQGMRLIAWVMLPAAQQQQQQQLSWTAGACLQ